MVRKMPHSRPAASITRMSAGNRKSAGLYSRKKASENVHNAAVRSMRCLCVFWRRSATAEDKQAYDLSARAVEIRFGGSRRGNGVSRRPGGYVCTVGGEVGAGELDPKMRGKKQGGVRVPPHHDDRGARLRLGKGGRGRIASLGEDLAMVVCL